MTDTITTDPEIDVEAPTVEEAKATQQAAKRQNTGTNPAAGLSTTSEVVPAPKPTREPSPDAGHYVVLVGIVKVATEDADPITEPEVWAPAGYGKKFPGTEEEAKKAALALESSTELRLALEAGDHVYLAAVPARSWRPKQVRYVVPDPVVRV